MLAVLRRDMMDGEMHQAVNLVIFTRQSVRTLSMNENLTSGQGQGQGQGQGRT